VKELPKKEQKIKKLKTKVWKVPSPSTSKGLLDIKRDFGG